MRMPHALLDTPFYISLSTKAKTLLIDMARQYNGFNNGDLQCTFSCMKKKGWKSDDTLTKAHRQLLEKGFLVLTRQGGRNLCSLFAITWKPINECGGKHHAKPSNVSLGYWKYGYNPDHDRVGEKTVFLPQKSG